MPCAVMGYWLCKCNAACTVCSPDQSINGDRRVIFNSRNDVDHSMLTQVVYMLSLSVVLIALVDMLAVSSVSTVALSFEQSGGGSTVGAELGSPNSYPGQLMRFEVCLWMETVLKVWVCSIADMWLQHDSGAITTAFALVVSSVVRVLMSCVLRWDMVEGLKISSLTSSHAWDASGSVAVLMFLYDAVVLSSTLPSLTWDAAGSGVRVLLSLYDSNVYSVRSSYCVLIRWKITPYAPEQEKPVLFFAWISFVYN